MTLIIQRGQLVSLIDAVGEDALFRLLEGDHLRLVYRRTHFAAIRVDNYRFDCGHIRMAGPAGGGLRWSSAFEDMTQYYLLRRGITRANRKTIERIRDRTIFQTEDENTLVATRAEFLDANLMQRLAKRHFKAACPDTSIERFELEQVEGQGFKVHTNLDLDALAAIVTVQTLVANLLEVNEAIRRSADGHTDLWLTEATSVLLEEKLRCLADRVEDNACEIQLFESVYFKRGHIRDEISSGRRSFSDLVDLLENPETMRFKIWLSTQKPSSRLFDEYNKAVHLGTDRRQKTEWGKISIYAGLGGAADSVLTSGPGSIASLAVSTGLGVFSAAVDKTLSGAGSLQRKDWRPNHWVDGAGRRFVQGREE